MLRTSSKICRSALSRSYATAASPHALVFLEHRAGVIDSGSLSALTAAGQLGGKVSALVVGSSEHVQGVVDQAKKFKGVTSVLHASSPQYAEPLPETLSPLLEKLLADNAFTHVVGATSSSAKSLLPRVSARLDAPTVSDVTSLEHDAATGSTTFTRPIYAGNAVSTVRAPGSLPVKFFTVRGTAFAPAPASEADAAEVKAVDPVEVANPTTVHVKTTIAKSDRPDLGVASRVVSGGRALKSAETFEKTLYPLADALGAAVGASRAAVDAGYADNSLQVGQTGKVVAPELYMAIGISGAIQHLAGMKDSKLIVAVNKDPDAPIFQVADVGLVADLFEVVPELTEKLKK
ncbi:putative electron transfer flavoprotein subunit alpha, mitochondrial [Psilocybe cubensis]|uniref:Electron transfer flavoprotein subunit alpha, mitochondrial n=2 Tax=Psilocybe cubensis TaxID=181762 RepID=A0ACB8HEA7_PSICU|nr:putative electron transfer flavoprotein subunit alpha, mitochondrial [Psilocybe cubensis]KAH9486211.1 putative electron transfer flavoprotein subunit alpha, mitochondrial [Psilocybe cubensis]